MKARTLSWTCLAAAAALAIAEPARAEPPAPAPAPASWTETGSWGWFVLGAGLVAGAIITTYGFLQDCGPDDADVSCQHRASLAIWGGFGVGALASAVGIAIVQSGRVRVQAAPTASGGSMLSLHASF